jgi:hypothetical protein
MQNLCIAVLLVDLDDTLVDRSEVIREWAAHTAQHHPEDKGLEDWLVEWDCDGNDIRDRRDFPSGVQTRLGMTESVGLEPTSREVEARNSVRLSYGGETSLHSSRQHCRHTWVWSRMQDSNPRRLFTIQELFPVGLIRPANPAVVKHRAAQWNRLNQGWCAGRGSNPRPSRYKRAAPTSRAPGALQILWCPRRDSNPHQSGLGDRRSVR